MYDNPKFYMVTIIAVLLSSCAYPHRVPETPEDAVTPTDAAAARLEASFVTEVNFQKNESALGADDRENLRKLVQESRKAGRIEEIMIISWADQEYPGEAKRRLSSAQVELATKRARSIRDFLEELAVSDIDTYNMAERPNVIERLLETSDMRVKRALEAAGVVGPGEVLGTKTSRALILVILEE